MGGVLLVVALAGACGPQRGNNLGFQGTSSDSGTGVHDAPPALGKDSGTTSLKKDGAASAGSDAATQGPPHACDMPSCTAAKGTCTNDVCTITEDPGGISIATQLQLNGSGTADSSFAFVYPYDHTVFPRGLISPTLQFAGTAPDAVMVHITYSAMDYTGYFGASANLQIPAASWTAITEGAWATDLVQVSVTKVSGGAVTGPVTEHWSVAQGSMRGQIYYETYGSQIIGGAGGVGIMSIAPGATAPTALKKGCGNVCHTASADGSTLVANVAMGMSSASYDLKNSAAKIYGASSMMFTYGGLYPDGSFAMSATNYRTWMNAPSRLHDTSTGAAISAPGWDSVIKNGGTVSFSPDGKFFAFIHEDEDDGAGHTLAMADFDVSTKTFSKITDMATNSTWTIGWPAFTPDSKTIVYHAGSDDQFETDGGALGDLYQVDVASHKVTALDALNGYNSGGTTSYLPANDPELNFAPTVLPEAVGGYFWIVFTSHRSYGNLLPSQDNGDQNGKLWVAALDLTATPGQDASHPAFYLDGQESAADNLRGFWVLPPCKQNSSSCTSGDECCSGFCRGSGSSMTCVDEPAGSCANEYEKCTTSSDCCNASAGYQCIGGFCTEPAPPTPK
jgi:hypothetical protein